jgi:hypothetical protein
VNRPDMLAKTQQNKRKPSPLTLNLSPPDEERENTP